MTDMITTPVKPSSGSWSLPNLLAPLKKLYVQVLVAVTLGILLGVVYPGLAVDLKPLSDAFITLIRAVVPPIIFATIAIGIAKMGDMRRVGVKAIVYFEADGRIRQ